MLTEDALFYFWQKGDEAQLSPNFKTTEMACHCANPTCRDQRIRKDLMYRLEQTRAAYGAAVMVTSGFRCHEHQEALKAAGVETAKGVSQHELGAAADIKGKDMLDLEAVVQPFFSAIGVARAFIHVDCRPPHSDNSKRLWYYK